MQAHIVGGGAVVKDLAGEFSVGDANIELARDYLSERGIRIIEERVGGDVGRHLSFDTASLRISIREIKKTVVLGRKHAS
jgi:chemotaxis receptor (MCP) glutamine deamidase CheD